MDRWLVKTEPETYSIDHLRSDQVTQWDGVRNALAQQYLRQMEVGNPVLIYHSGREKAIVGLAEVVREKYLDPSDERGRAVCVDIKFAEAFENPIPLTEIKANSKLKQMPLVKISRLSVMPVGRAHWRVIMGMLGRE